VNDSREEVDAWCIKFDKRIVTYVDSRIKGHKEDFSFEELEAAVELHEEHEEEDKQGSVAAPHVDVPAHVARTHGATVV